MNHQKKWLRAHNNEPDPRLKKIADVIRYAAVVNYGNVSNADEVAKKILEKLK